MTNAANRRETTFDGLLRSIFERLRRLERPSTIHLGGAGNGWTLSSDVNGNLVATSDTGTATTIALK